MNALGYSVHNTHLGDVRITGDLTVDGDSDHTGLEVSEIKLIGVTNNTTLKANPATENYTFNFPVNAGINGQVLQTTGSNTQWVNDLGGDVVGTTVSTTNEIPVYADSTGKNIKASIVSIDNSGYLDDFNGAFRGTNEIDMSTGDNNRLIMNSSGLGLWVASSEKLSLTPTLATLTTTLSMGNNKINDLQDPFAAQDAVTKNYTDTTFAAGPLTPVINDNLVTFDGVSGKLLKDSGIGAVGGAITGVTTVNYKGGVSALETVVKANDNTSAWTMTLPLDGGTTGQVLVTDGSGVLTWEDSGDVLGPASSTDFNLAMFNGTSGKLLADSGITVLGGAVSGVVDLTASSTLSASRLVAKDWKSDADGDLLDWATSAQILSDNAADNSGKQLRLTGRPFDWNQDLSNYGKFRIQYATPGGTGTGIIFNKNGETLAGEGIERFCLDNRPGGGSGSSAAYFQMFYNAFPTSTANGVEIPNNGVSVLRPKEDANRDLGETGRRFKDAHFSGTVNATSLDASFELLSPGIQTNNIVEKDFGVGVSVESVNFLGGRIVMDGFLDMDNNDIDNAQGLTCANATVTGDILYDNPHAEGYLFLPRTTTGIGTTPIKVDFDSQFTNTFISGFTVDNTGRFTYLSGRTRRFRMSLHISFSGSSNTFLRFTAYKNGTTSINSSVAIRKIGSGGDLGALSSFWMVELAASEYVELFVDAIAETGKEITVDACTIDATWMPYVI